VLFVDLDRFKLVNDSLGHDAGDMLLVEISRRLGAAVRQGDLVTRFGGDEFVVLCQGVENEQEAGVIAARLLEALTGPVQLEGTEVRVSASVGVVLADESYTAPESLVRDADVAMYQAKAHGRDRHELFDAALRQQAVRRLEMEEALRAALHTDELSLAFQPVICAYTGRVLSTEALLRWMSPVFGVVTPAEFIPIAEETGLIVTLGRRVLEMACTQTLAWRSTHEALADLHVAVNLSARQLTDPDLVRVVAGTLASTGLPATALTLEITESMLMEDADAAASTLRRLSEIGVRLSIDDFGTGYSSLAYLTRFPVDELKVDRSFVDGMAADDADAVIVASVIALAHTLGLDVVAEGVETAEQLHILQDLGCDSVQGYHLGRPASAADVLDRLLRPATV
jgi:diguanylate cyclase (GGDEF)-like protein